MHRYETRGYRLKELRNSQDAIWAWGVIHPSGEQIGEVMTYENKNGHRRWKARVRREQIVRGITKRAAIAVVIGEAELRKHGYEE